MDSIQLVLSDPTLMYLLLIMFVSTIILLGIKYLKKKKQVGGTEMIEDVVENIRSDAGYKFKERLEEKKALNLTMEQAPLLPNTRNRESHKNIIEELMEDDKDENDSSNLVM